MRKNIGKMYTYVAKNLITVAVYKCVLKVSVNENFSTLLDFVFFGFLA